MNHCTLAALLLATPFPTDLLPLTERLLASLQRLEHLIQAFRSQPVTPEATAAFEQSLLGLTRDLGRDVLEQVFNHLEPELPEQAPARLHVEGTSYRRRNKSPKTFATLFGPVRVSRLLYESLEAGRPCLVPLQLHLGVVAGRATPALARKVGQLSAGQTQRAVLRVLAEDHQIHWCHKTLRAVTAELASNLKGYRQAFQARRVVEWLRQAQRGKGPRRPVLAVGRDGIHVPLTAGKYNEASTATVSVYDQHGKRLGTVYLGQMPLYQQEALSEQLTGLLQEVFSLWRGARPRLAYVTDGGWHPTDYYDRVLRRMADPRNPGQRLVWERVIDFYHAACYVSQLSVALFKDGCMARYWARQMRKLLKEGRGGATRVLQSASYYFNREKLSAARREEFRKAHGYLQRHRRYMDYARYRAEGLPIGSGVTEAACKTTFTQRLKQSGMRWGLEGGQVIVDLRVLCMSGVYEDVFKAHLQRQSQELKGTWTVFPQQNQRRTG